MATTTNYGWTTPNDTDLVKDGAAAIRTLGSSVDTTTKNLNPQTTTGALAYRSATANVNTALPIGTAGQVLQVNSGATAPEWATPAGGGGMTLLNSGSTTLSGTTTTFNITTTGYKHLFVVLKDIYTAAEGTSFNLRINGDTDGDYYHAFNYQFGTTTAGDAVDGATSFPIQFRTSSTNGSYFFVSGGFWLMQVQDSTTHICNWQVHGHSNSGTGQTVTNGSGFYRASAVVSSISFVSGQSVSGGEAFIYGVK